MKAKVLEGTAIVQKLFSGRRRFGIAAGWDKDGYEKHGRQFYKEAAQLRAAEMLEINGVMVLLAEKFPFAAKPLSFMSSRYLGLFKDSIFLQ